MSGAKGQRYGMCGELSLEQIREMRAKGALIREIAALACVEEISVRSFCSRHRIVGPYYGHGPRHGKPMNGKGIVVPYDQNKN